MNNCEYCHSSSHAIQSCPFLRDGKNFAKRIGEQGICENFTLDQINDRGEFILKEENDLVCWCNDCRGDFPRHYLVVSAKIVPVSNVKKTLSKLLNT